MSPVTAPLARAPDRLGDFNISPRAIPIVLLACVIGAIGTFVAVALLDLIALITNLVFFQRVSLVAVAPGSASHSAWLILGAPIAGGLIVGAMARFGSEAIRGHGMPEAIDTILRGRSVVRPRLAILKPVSAAISIGTGGPFGAEGPIIMTGGAFGSICAQLLKLTADERKTLLVAGAAAGMTATFNAPFASILLAIELLLFEWRPRSFLPVTAAAAVAAILRAHVLGPDPIFPVAEVARALDGPEQLLCVVAGCTGGLLALVATRLVYFSEDMFKRLPIHWAWWPALGGVIIGLGGLVEPRALGVGYDVIAELLSGRAELSLVVGILVVKTLIWSLSLGSGTSGGVLAPVFMIGAALGALEARVFPSVAPGFWSLISLAAVMGGVMRSPLTGVIFALELTHDWTAFLPLTIASASAYGLSALTLKRSVLTEKVARKGFHLTREYSVDPLESLLVGDVMAREFTSFSAKTPLREAVATFVEQHGDSRERQRSERLYPVLDDAQQLVGVVTRSDLFRAALAGDAPLERAVQQLGLSEPAVCHDDMTLREAAHVFAERGISGAPVVTREDPRRVVGIVALADLLEGRLRDLQEERDSERVLELRDLLRLRRRESAPD
ncbi:MAG: chloride channel protein [Myxococcota bacterium]